MLVSSICAGGLRSPFTPQDWEDRRVRTVLQSRALPGQAGPWALQSD